MNRESQAWTVGAPRIVRQVGAMPYREFGRTGVQVSELSFGSWAIGGKAYGAVERSRSLAALAHAEALGCNVVDTAGVYGDAESVLGEFLAGRRDRWFVSTKFSGQAAGLEATVNAQLERLRTDYLDFYMIHWVPRGEDAGLLRGLQDLKQSGKVRFIGLSVYDVPDVDFVLREDSLDGLMLPFSLLDPDPFLARRARLAASGKAVMVRSALKEGFLTGKYRRDAKFSDPDDQRSRMTADDIATRVGQAERLRFLEAGSGSLTRAAIAYPLSFPEVSTVVVGVKTVAHADLNFGKAAGSRLAPADLERVARLQRELGVHKPGSWLRAVWSRLRG